MKKFTLLFAILSLVLIAPKFVFAGLSEGCFPAVSCSSGQDYYGSACQSHIETLIGASQSCQSVKGTPTSGNQWAFDCAQGCYQAAIPTTYQCSSHVVDIGTGLCCTDGQVPKWNATTTPNKWECAAAGGSSSWTTSGPDIYRNTGNVGIGTTTPADNLEVVSSDEGQLKLRTSLATGNRKAGLSFNDSATTPSSVGIYASFEQAGATLTHRNKALEFFPMSGGRTNFYDGAGAQSANVKMTILDNGNVGIGTSSPASKLDVVGAVDVTEGYKVDNEVIISNTGSVHTAIYTNSTTPRYGYFEVRDGNNSDTNTNRGAYFGWGSIGSYVSLQLLNNNALYIGGGNVGIGTTAPLNKLDIEGGVAIGVAYSGTRSAPENGLIVEGNVGVGTYTPTMSLEASSASLYGMPAIGVSSGTRWAYLHLNTTGAHSLIWDNASVMRFGTETAKATGYSEKMRITANGSVGIGTSTPSTSFKLDVNGNTKTLGLLSGPMISVANSSIPVANVAFDPDIRNAAATGFKFTSSSPGGRLGAGGMTLSTDRTAAKNITTAAGLSVSWNPTTPSATNINTYTAVVGLANTTEANSLAIGGLFSAGSSTTPSYAIVASGNSLFNGVLAAKCLCYKTSASSTTNTCFGDCPTVDPPTTGSKYKPGGVPYNPPKGTVNIPDVPDLVNLFPNPMDAVTGGGLQTGFNGEFATDNIAFDPNSHQNLIAFNSSDIRLKKDIISIGEGLEKVMSLRPVEYRWRDSLDQSIQIGLIAQEVEKIIPEVVVPFPQPGLPDAKGIKYEQLTPVLIKAIQEQQATIKSLEARIEKLEAK